MVTNEPGQATFKDPLHNDQGLKPGKVDCRVGLAVALLIKNQKHSHLSVNDLAKRVRLSPSRLRQLFKAETGTSPIKYRRLLRLEHAKSLLENSLLSVKEIAGEVGYSDVSHFVRDFRIRYNVRPLEARSLSIGPSGRQELH
jgi:transcriptional regulator GlxA family with amidase domain